MRSGNGAGDPVPAFDAAHDTVLMAQLENIAGLGGFYVARGDVSVSRSEDGGVTWSEPVTVSKGQGAGIGPATQREVLRQGVADGRQQPGSPHYGRAYLTATRFENGLQDSYAGSPIYLSYSDDGGRTWSEPRVISGSNPEVCTYQETGPAGECDEDQFSIPEVAHDGTLYVHFQNFQNEAEWETAFDFDSQIMVTRSVDGGETFSSPVPTAQFEDGLTDMPYSVINRPTLWGHQIRWTSAGTVTVDPTVTTTSRSCGPIAARPIPTPRSSACSSCPELRRTTTLATRDRDRRPMCGTPSPPMEAAPGGRAPCCTTATARTSVPMGRAVRAATRLARRVWPIRLRRPRHTRGGRRGQGLQRVPR
jgi:hypothetical protein